MRFQLQRATNPAAAQLPPPASLFTGTRAGSKLLQLGADGPVQRRHKQRMRQLEEQLFGGQAPATGDDRLAQAAAAAAHHEISRLEAEVTAAAQTVGQATQSVPCSVAIAARPVWHFLYHECLAVFADIGEQSICAQAQLADNLISGLFGRNADQEKARKAKHAQQQKVEEAMAPLLGWLRGGYLGFTLLPAGVQQAARQAGVGERWTAGKR